MTTGWVQGYDATTTNQHLLPRGAQWAGYTTGPGVEWTPQQLDEQKGTVRICQDASLSDATADVADIEFLAGTVGGVPGWVIRAREAIQKGERPGQRKMPCAYQSASWVTSVVNSLIRNHITGGVGLWIAHFGVPEAQAIQEVLMAAGPFPVVGFQYSDNGDNGAYDEDVFSTAWLADTVGGPTPPPVNLPPTLLEGDTGGWVSVCQRALNMHGSAPSLAVDGDFGPRTLQSVEFFQHMESITVDGIVGPVTWGKLGY